ncbi:MAG TPA: SRPBCC family protein [Puia sp.]|nr:SRPBCC family protein [Puia sp.]
MSSPSFTLSHHDGSLFRTPDTVGVCFERILEHPVRQVWEALTNPEHLSKWLAPTVIKGGVGGTISLQLTGGVMGGTILQWKEQALLEYVWHTGSVVRWELLNEGRDRTRLIFTHTHVRENQLLDAAKGWHYHLDLLSLTLDGAAKPDNPVGQWDAITRDATLRYRRSLEELRRAPAPFVIERVFDAPVERVWQALTRKEEIKRWSFDIADFEPVEGYEFTFFGDREGRRKVHFCRVTEVICEQKLSYSWRYENIIGITHVTWELFAEGDKTRLRLTHEGLEKLQHAGPDYARQNFQAGWTQIFDMGLRPLLQATIRVPAR